MNAIVKQNGNGAVALAPEIIESLVLNGDLSKMSQAQKLAYYKYRCQQVDLDPSAKPFDLLTLQGKQILYANAGCTQQLCERRSLSPVIAGRDIIDGICIVTSRVTDKGGRTTENVGAVPVGGLKGNELANAIMKAVTKAHRRTILAHCGLGMLDETEVETIPGAQTEPKGRGNPFRQEYQGYAHELDACKSQEQVDLLLESPEFKAFCQEAGKWADEKGATDYGGYLQDYAEQRKKKLPPKVEISAKQQREIENAAQSSADVAPAGADAQLESASESGSTPPPQESAFSPLFEKCAEKFDIAEDVDTLKIAQDFAKQNEKELTAGEKKLLNGLSRKVATRLRESAA